MNERFLAIDIGAGSGRATLGFLDDSHNLRIKEVHRFSNNMIKVGGNLYWNVQGLYEDILRSLKICSFNSKEFPTSVGIDTWGVDFALLDSKGYLTGRPFAYRNSDVGPMEDFFHKINRRRIYNLTGIQFQPFNTLYQIHSMVKNQHPQIKNASDLLFMPDLFNYFLTGSKRTEFTISTTSQLFNPHIFNWDEEILKELAIPDSMMQEIVFPGTIIGETSEVKRHIPTIPVVAVASHDTASAFAAIPTSDEETVRISSGTWSLVGLESDKPVINDGSFKYNLTNEGGICGKFCLIKNIPGLWILQECKREWDKKHRYTYSELMEKAKTAESFSSLINPGWKEFVSPKSMPSEIQRFCKHTLQKVPRNVGQITRVILESLSLAHKYAINQLEKASNKTIKKINIVGGGSQNSLLCQFTADSTGLPVYAGPIEATSIGNILVQAMALDRLSSLGELRDTVKKSFRLKKYEPQNSLNWETMYERFKEISQSSNFLKY